jgi:Transcription factor WhiB
MVSADPSGTAERWLGPSDLRFLLTIDGRLFETEAATPCRVNTDGDLWFSPFRDRIRAARQCQGCPFVGRCGYNAVVSRATHGVWGGEFSERFFRPTGRGKRPTLERWSPIPKKQPTSRRSAKCGGYSSIPNPLSEGNSSTGSPSSTNPLPATAGYGR